MIGTQSCVVPMVVNSTWSVLKLVTADSGLKRKKPIALVPLLNSQTNKSNGDKQTTTSPAWLELNLISAPELADKSHCKTKILTANTKSPFLISSSGWKIVEKKLSGIESDSICRVFDKKIKLA